MPINMKTLSGIVVVISSILVTAASNAQIIANPTKELSSFCDFNSNRQTIIYLDQSVISRKDENWFKDIQRNIEFLPAEPIKVRMIPENKSIAVDVWNVCFPALSPADYQAEKQKDSIFSKGVDRRIKDAKELFAKLMNSALAFPLRDIQREQVPFYEANFPEKSILEALYYDLPQFRVVNATTRVIIFSDMVENSRHFNPANLKGMNASALADKAAKAFAADFKNSEFYVYGVGYTHKDSELSRNLELFWSQWLNRSAAHLAGFSRQLNIPSIGNSLNIVSFSGFMNSPDNTHIAVRLRLGTTKSGTLNNSWFGVREIRYPLAGDYVCIADKCEIRAQVVYAIDGNSLFNVGDIIRLEGSLNGELQGFIGAEDGLTRTQSGQEFKLPLVLKAEELISF